MYVVEQFYKKILKKEPPYYAKCSLLTMAWKHDYLKQKQFLDFIEKSLYE